MEITKSLINQIVHRVAGGARPRAAAGAVGVPVEVFDDWMAKGAKHENGLYRDLVTRIEQARDTAECDAVDRVISGVKGWQGPAWYLERTRPTQYGQRITIDDRAKDRATAYLLRILSDRLDPEVFREVVACIVHALNDGDRPETDTPIKLLSSGSD